MSTDAHAIFEAPSRAEADARLATSRATWGGLEAEVVRLLTKDVDACLTFYSNPIGFVKWKRHFSLRHIHVSARAAG